MTVSKSDTVIINDPAVTSNGSTEHAAIVTAVHGGYPNPLINATAFPDGGSPYNLYSVYHRSERPEGMAIQTWHRRDDLELPAEHAPGGETITGGVGGAPKEVHAEDVIAAEDDGDEGDAA